TDAVRADAREAMTTERWPAVNVAAVRIVAPVKAPAARVPGGSHAQGVGERRSKIVIVGVASGYRRAEDVDSAVAMVDDPNFASVRDANQYEVPSLRDRHFSERALRV